MKTSRKPAEAPPAADGHSVNHQENLLILFQMRRRSRWSAQHDRRRSQSIIQPQSTMEVRMNRSLKYRIANAILLVLTAVLAAGCWEC